MWSAAEGARGGGKVWPGFGGRVLREGRYNTRSSLGSRVAVVQGCCGVGTTAPAEGPRLTPPTPTPPHRAQVKGARYKTKRALMETIHREKAQRTRVTTIESAAVTAKAKAAKRREHSEMLAAKKKAAEL